MMPKIQWTDLPEAIRKHPLLRLKERKITEEELYELTLARVGTRGAGRCVVQGLRARSAPQDVSPEGTVREGRCTAVRCAPCRTGTDVVCGGNRCIP